MKNENNYNHGLNFAEGLTLVFIALKLCKIINWSWWWVLAPTWIGFIVGIVAIIIALIMR